MQLLYMYLGQSIKCGQEELAWQFANFFVNNIIHTLTGNEVNSARLFPRRDFE